MFLKIIGDCDEAAKKLGTNVKLRNGQMLRAGDDAKIKMMAQKYPELFECVDEEGKSYQEARKPKKNKLYPKKRNKFKW